MGFFGNIGSFFKKSAKSLSNPVGYMKNLGSALTPSNWFSDYDGNMGVFGNMSGNFQDFWDSYTGRDVAMKNYELQKKQFKYQQDLNAEQQAREDNAMQRKVADLKAAGLNPVLAANGTGAASAPLKAAPAPQIENTSGAMRETLNNAFQGMLQVMSMKKDFAQKDATIKLLQAEKEKAEAEATGINIKNKYDDDYYAGRNKAQNLANIATERKMPAEIKKLYNDVDIQEQNKVLLNLDAEAARLKISGYELDNIRKELDNKGALIDLSIKEQEIMINSLAIARKTLENEEYSYAIKFYHDRFFGLPYDGHSIPSVETLTYMAIRQGLDVVADEIPDKAPKEKPWKALRKATSYPSSKNSTWNSIQQSYQDYGVRRNH